MMVLDTTILVYAVGEDHPLARPCRRVVKAVGDGRMQATTTVGVIQEFVHVRARRRSRRDAVHLGAEYITLLSPLLPVERQNLEAGFELFQRHQSLGAFDAVLAAASIAGGAEGLISADSAFASVPGLVHFHPSDEALESLLGD